MHGVSRADEAVGAAAGAAKADPAVRHAVDHLHVRNDRTARRACCPPIMHAFSCVGPDAWNCLRPDDRQMLHMPIFHIGGAFIATVVAVHGQLDRRGQPFPHRGVLGPGRELESHHRFLLGAMATFLLKQPPSRRIATTGCAWSSSCRSAEAQSRFASASASTSYTLFNMTEISTPLISRANPGRRTRLRPAARRRRGAAGRRA